MVHLHPSKSDGKDKLFFNEMSIGQKIQYIYKGITIEPMVVCFVLPSMLLQLGVQNLNLEKACRVNLDYNQTVCDALRVRDTAHYKMEEIEVQKLVATMSGWKHAIHSAAPCLLILFFGAWSDRNGKRKPCMIIPLCGQIAMAFSLLLVVYFERTPIEVAIFVELFFPCITGSHFTMMVGIFSYLADITTESERTVRLGIVSMVHSVAIPFGMAFSGLLVRRIGFYGVFSLAGSLYMFALYYGVFVLKDVPRKEKPVQLTNKSFLADFFDFGHIKETFMVAFKARVKNRRKKILAIMILIIIIVGAQHGEMSLFYLFVRYKFNWSEIEFSFFQAYNMAVHLIGTSFTVSVFAGIFKMEDALIGTMASFSKILANFVYAFAQVEWQLFIGPFAEIIGGGAMIAMRSISSKCVSSNELGKVNSLFAIVDSIAPSLYAPVLAAIYSATITKMPGAFFLVGGIMTIPGIFLFIWLYTVNRSDAKVAALEKEQEKEYEKEKAKEKNTGQNPMENIVQSEGKMAVISDMQNI